MPWLRERPSPVPSPAGLVVKNGQNPRLGRMSAFGQKRTLEHQTRALPLMPALVGFSDLIPTFCV
jgi:hypothetical protein